MVCSFVVGGGAAPSCRVTHSTNTVEAIRQVGGKDFTDPRLLPGLLEAEGLKDWDNDSARAAAMRGAERP
jgi:hypothetical protein